MTTLTPEDQALVAAMDQLAAALYIAIRDHGVNQSTLPNLYTRYYMPLVLARGMVTEYAARIRESFRVGLMTRSSSDGCGYIILDDISGCLLISTADEVNITRDTIAFWKVRDVHEAYRTIRPEMSREYDIASAIRDYIIR